jgi:hypothetical protein
VSEDDETFQLLLLRRLEGQGPRHPSTMTTLHNLMYGDIKGVRRAIGDPAELPQGVTADGVRLDGDHVDRQVDLVQDALTLQEHRVETFGPDDPRTMVATSYLAYALAFADHIDGQVESAAVLAKDAHEGLADAADEGHVHVGPHDVRIAELIRGWIDDRLDQPDG